MPTASSRRPRGLRSLVSCLAVIGVCCGLGVEIAAQDTTGLALQIAGTTADGTSVEETRLVRSLTLAIPKDARPAPECRRVADAPFVARFVGKITLKQRDRYTFTYRGNGTFELKLAGETVLATAVGGVAEGEISTKALRLKKGEHQIEAIYTSVPGDDVRIRVDWQSRRFGREPMPPGVFSTSLQSPALSEGLLLAHARSVVAARRCISCHVLPEEPVSASSEGSASQLGTARGPDLTGVGSRLEASWMARWLEAPRAWRPGARMPHLLHGSAEDVARDARDLAAFLGGLTRDPEGAPDPKDTQVVGDVSVGAVLFGDLGCVSCHDVAASESEDASGPLDEAPLDLRSVGEKYQQGELAAFLQAPAQYHAGSRMPDFGFDAEEASHLEAFLRTLPSRRVEVGAASDAGGAGSIGDPKRGRARAADLNCASCHALPGWPWAGSEGVSAARSQVPGFDDVLTTLASTPPENWQACVGPSTAPNPEAADHEVPDREGDGGGSSGGGASGGDLRRDGIPDFGFQDRDRDALAALAARDDSTAALRPGAPDALAMHVLRDRRCTACHVLDGAQDAWSRRSSQFDSVLTAVLAGEGFDDEGGGPTPHRPSLTWAGDKLRRDFLRGLFAGDQGPSRPWLHARMPRFPDLAESLPAGLAAMHGHLDASVEAENPIDPARVKIGETLVSARGGFACVTCHGVGETPPLAVFEVQGINFATSAVRLRSGYYHRWMADPFRIDPASRMPRYADQDGQTAFTDVLEGRAEAQFDAIWHYLRALRPPEPGSPARK